MWTVNQLIISYDSDWKSSSVKNGRFSDFEKDKDATNKYVQKLVMEWGKIGEERLSKNMRIVFSKIKIIPKDNKGKKIR